MIKNFRSGKGYTTLNFTLKMMKMANFVMHVYFTAMNKVLKTLIRMATVDKK
jgi:hypothetical protein